MPPTLSRRRMGTIHERLLLSAHRRRRYSSGERRKNRSSFFPHLNSDYKRRAHKRAKKYQICVSNNIIRIFIPSKTDIFWLQKLTRLDRKKKLLVLDLDECLIHKFYDRRSNARESLRPYLQHFLRHAYRKYNLILWSASSMTRIRSTMDRLGLSNQHDFR